MSEATKTPNTPVRDSEISPPSSLEPSTETSTLSTATLSATSAATYEGRSKTLSETQQDLGDTAATTQHDQGESPSKTIWRNVANVCCWRSATDRLGAPLDEGETRAVEMKVEDFREEERSDAVTSQQRETSVSTSGPQSSTSGSTSRPSAPGSTSQPSTSESTSRSESRTSGSTSPVNMFPGMSRLQQEAYERMRDPKHEMMEARLYDENMARIMAEGFVSKETRHPSASGFTSQPSASGSTSRSEFSTSGSTSPRNMFPDMSRSQQEICERLRDPAYEMMEARLYDEKMARKAVGYVPMEETIHPWRPLEIPDQETLYELWRPPPRVTEEREEEEMSAETRRRRDLDEMAMMAQPREFAEAMRRQHTKDDSDGGEDSEETSSEFSSETSRELAKLIQRQEMVDTEGEEDSEDDIVLEE